jgi:Domain of unknown function (DUF4249)
MMDFIMKPGNNHLPKHLDLRAFAFLLGISVLLVACEKEIEVEIPAVDPKVVVEGNIEQGQPPIVLLSWSQGYFEPTDLNSLSEMYIKGATVTVSDGVNTVQLDEICTADIPAEFLELAAEALGFSAEQLQQFNICAYSKLDDQTIWGEEGKIYNLTIDYNEHHLTAQTKICNLVELDNLWFEIMTNDPNDSLGFIFGNLTDPDTLGNAYRWYAKRINHYPAWEDSSIAGEQKDAGYIAPIGSVFDDEFFNGLSFEFGYYRGALINSDKRDDIDVERGFYKTGDTVAVKGCVIDRGVYNFLSAFEDQISSQGSPFSVPFNVPSNINGGLGVWAGYGAVLDTVICQ